MWMRRLHRPCFKSKCSIRFRNNESRYYSITASSAPVEEVTVPCGSNGTIKLRIHGMHGATSATPPPLVLHLSPRSLTGIFKTRDDSASVLARLMPSVVVEILYRADSVRKYPTPIHDVMFGYDWVLKHLVPSRSFLAPTFNDHSPARIGVYGEGSGAGLAAMLALTECRTKGHRIAAAALHDPLLNWVMPEEVTQDLDEAAMRRDSRRRPAFVPSNDTDTSILRAIVSARSELFKTPGDWFDPFASPLLFFRSSNAAIPTSDPNAPVDEFAELSAMNQHDFMRQQLKLSAMSNFAGHDTGIDVEDDPVGSLRRSARRYPRIDSGLTLPNFRLTIGPDGVWRAQAEEFTKYVWRSMIRTDELKKQDMAAAELHAAERVFHESYDGEIQAEECLADTAEWLRDVL
ncbi:hypothetical protein BDZ85DRAFT_216616 [Elsinoe ampelina]|uniref:Alpha/beta hydrolase fold-3 domain-containing protein n=1 Tax=Elsinoe ampelina TaxID=302913 RepID=A0A6A6GFP9_9PEZI|nr:hypothetical protein BDZ85DRAFT_216616 [Elsinoe ampelina]